MTFIEKHSDFSARQFITFRILFGIYLTCHFASLIPYGVELFSDVGILGGEGVNPFNGSWPNPLFLEGSSNWITPWLITALIASVSFTLGFLRRSIALFLCFTMSCLFTANPLIANPSLGYIGMLLLLCAAIPPLTKDWKMPHMACLTAWILLAAGYTFSGILKLSSPSWINGSALQHLLENPLARPGVIRDLMLSLPDGFLSIMTWSVLLLEVSFVPLAVFKKTRFWAWSLMLLIHLGIMTTVDFTDLSLGMVMVHLFTFQRNWLPSRKSIGEMPHILFIDGDCAFCQKSAQILTSIDSHQAIYFSTLTGETSAIIPKHINHTEKRAAVLLENPTTENQRTWQGADAILRALYLCGGAFAFLWILRFLPRWLKDGTYSLIAKNRLRIPFISKSCPLLTPVQQKRYLP
ncbi:MAG: DCC1-like thiol-disulfide oxidoreductase family protein [Akkermansiaceae bacterium]